MLNSNNQRELVYVVKIDNITPIKDYDKVELAHIAGWTVVVGKDQFKPGDLAIYFEIDSKLPEVSPFIDNEFLVKKHLKVKTQKMCKSVSQGLIMHPSDFGWTVDSNTKFNSGNGEVVRTGVKDEEGVIHYADDETRFLTEKLKVTYITSEDNHRKAHTVDKYRRMAQKNPKLGKTFWWKYLYSKKWGKKVLFFFFGRKTQISTWPEWVIKTDEERCQNIPWLFPGKEEEKWIVTEKIDGTSTTFTMKGYGRKRKFFVCSRNVVFDSPDKQCFYDTNVYLEMAKKYNVESLMSKMMDNILLQINNFSGKVDYITIQGETFGGNIQKNSYSTNEHDFRVFNIIVGNDKGEKIRLNPIEGKKLAEFYGLKYVPIVEENFVLPETCEKMLEYAHGNSEINGELREGVVLRSYDGVRSFKAVDNEYLITYHI